MRFALGVDEDIRPFLRRFAGDPLIGRSLRRRPWLRVLRRPEPFEALAWAICEQLIEYERAAAIERRVVAALGRRWTAPDGSSLRDLPAASVLAGTAPALLQSFDLAGGRAITLVRAAREVARGRIDLHDPDHERAWRRLRAIPGIGPWTVEMLALNGQGRHDQVPAGDVGLLKLVGRLTGGGNPRTRAEEWQVREFFAPYGEWAGLAVGHMFAA
jgi:3-methyladenine DNA glycosylase/8-oxoguanine DNA glycosylase